MKSATCRWVSPDERGNTVKYIYSRDQEYVVSY